MTLTHTNLFPSFPYCLCVPLKSLKREKKRKEIHSFTIYFCISFTLIHAKTNIYIFIDEEQERLARRFILYQELFCFYLIRGHKSERQLNVQWYLEGLQSR